jgi:dynein intermediate chain 2
MEKMSETSFIWDVNNPNTPEQELVPTSPLCCLEYNPKDPHLLVGGSYNGLISYWDTRKGSAPADSSIIEKSHRDPVYKMQWLHGKTPFECASTSTDGQVLWWDIRKLGEPSEQLMLEDKTDGRLMGGVSMEYGLGGGPSKFLIGTEQGKVVSCSRKAKNPADKIGMIYDGHCGPVYGLQRNLFFPKYFLTVGDWTVRLWNEELRSPIMTSKYFKNYVLDATWSFTRPGVFITTKMDGTLDVWDYFYKQNDPTLSLQVDGDGLRTVRMQEQGSLLATGSVDGSVYMLELCEGLAQIQPNEKNSVMQMLERESKREKNLDARAKELRQKEKRASEQAAGDQTEKAPWEETVKGIEEKFWEAIGGKEAAGEQ